MTLFDLMMISIGISLLIFMGNIENVNATPILHGEDIIDPLKYPFMARLTILSTIFENDTYRQQQKYLCGGVILKMNIILTAAHCLSDSLDVPDVTIRVGLLSTKQKGQIAKMSNFIIHQDFDDTIYDEPIKKSYYPHDIAIIWLNQPFIQNDKVKIGNILKRNPINGDFMKLNGKKGFAIGWGVDHTNNYPDLLKIGKMNIISNSNCEEQLETLLINAFCVLASNRKTGPGTGDSGGPFIIDDNLVVGLSSWGLTDYIPKRDGSVIGVCVTCMPSVFVRLDAYTDWIEEKILNKQENPNSSRKSPTPSSSHKKHSCKLFKKN